MSTKNINKKKIEKYHQININRLMHKFSFKVFNTKNFPIIMLPSSVYNSPYSLYNIHTTVLTGLSCAVLYLWGQQLFLPPPVMSSLYSLQCETVYSHLHSRAQCSLIMSPVWRFVTTSRDLGLAQLEATMAAEENRSVWKLKSSKGMASLDGFRLKQLCFFCFLLSLKGLDTTMFKVWVFPYKWSI